MKLNPIAPSPAAPRHLQSASPLQAGSPAQAGDAPLQADPSLERVSEAVTSINQSMNTLARGLEFSIDTDSKRTVVKVIDQETKELIRQIPTEEALEIAQALEQAQGLLIKQTA